MSGIIGLHGSIKLTLAGGAKCIGQLTFYDIAAKADMLRTTKQGDKYETYTKGLIDATAKVNFNARYYNKADSYSAYQLLSLILFEEDDAAFHQADFFLQTLPQRAECTDAASDVYLRVSCTLTNLAISLQMEDSVKCEAALQFSGVPQLIGVL